MFWKQNDHSALHAKARLRIKFLQPDANVLDLFCGGGRMYEMVYRDRAKKYHGVDNKKIHDPAICTLSDNSHFVRDNNISDFNVFDLDAYGSPVLLLYTVVKKIKGPKAAFFLTDGTPLRQRIDHRVMRIVSATEGIPRKFHIPEIYRWYESIFATMLRDIEAKYGWTTTTAKSLTNETKGVYYWYLEMIKKGEGNDEHCL